MLGYLLTARINPDKLILMQYTGLKDNNDKEIYEGDVVEYRGYKYGDQRYVVVYDFEWGCGDLYFFTVKNYKTKKKYNNFQRPENEYLNTLICVGNIYENPELLEENK